MPALLALAVAACGSKKEHPAAGVPVTLAQAQIQSVPLTLEAVGNVEALASVAVKSRVDGQITEVLVADGQDVTQGQPLFQIDRRPFEIQLQQAQALLATARAQEARYRDLLAKKFVSPDSYAQIKSARDTAEAAEREARLQLEYSGISAPFAGRLGRISLQRGNLVKANDLPLVVLNQMDPIYVTFSAPEQSLPDIRAAMDKGKLVVSARFPRHADAPLKGELAFVDNAVDTATGTVKLRASFGNAGGQLWPGQFVNVSMDLGIQASAVAIPPAAVQTGPKGTYVFVVGADSTASMRDVVIARSTADAAVVQQGLTAGEQVVIDGQSRLTPGAKISAQQPASAAASNQKP